MNSVEKIAGWFVLLSMSLVGCGLSPHSSASPSKVHSHSVSILAPLTANQVSVVIQRNHPTHSVSKVHIIHLANFRSKASLAFASFRENGTQKYITVAKSLHGITTGTFVVQKIHGVPIQANQIYNGTYAVLSGVVTNSRIRNVILTFPSGHVTEVPVSHGYFWLMHRAYRHSPNTAFVKCFVGVSAHGHIFINNAPNKPSGTIGCSTP